jgi:hypothetical protein
MTDPGLFVSDLQDTNKKNSSFLLITFLKVHLHHFPKIKSHKEVTKLEKYKFSLLFLLDG